VAVPVHRRLRLGRFGRAGPLIQDDDQTNKKGSPTLVRLPYLYGLCPRCGSRTLFDGVVQFAPDCRICGMDFSKFNVGDGPAAFLTLIVGALVVGGAAWLQISFAPPFWVHAMLWVPISSVLVVYGLRIAKSALLYTEYARSAGEAGRKK